MRLNFSTMYKGITLELLSLKLLLLTFCLHIIGSFFIGSMSVYTLKHKAKLLDVDEKHADEVDCVSPKVASEMSEGILKVILE